MGQALKIQTPSYWKAFTDKLKKLYVTQWKGFKQEEMCAATLVLEGSEEVLRYEILFFYSHFSLSVLLGSQRPGKANLRDRKAVWRFACWRGERPLWISLDLRHCLFESTLFSSLSYSLPRTHLFIQDLGFEYSVLGESFETSIPWDKVLDVCRNVKELLHRECKRHGIKTPILASSRYKLSFLLLHSLFVYFRVTQLYDSGACVYFYFGFNYRNVEHPLEVYEEIEVRFFYQLVAFLLTRLGSCDCHLIL